MAKVTFEDKVTLNENADIPNINKCRASDLNELKAGINALYDDKNIMMINLDSVQTITTTTETKVLFNKKIFQLGDKLTFENNGIKIGAGVSKVRIDLTLWLEGHVTDTYGAFYIVNSRTGVLTYNLKQYYGKIVWGTANSYIYADVQEGDIIFANVRFSVAGNNNAVAGNYKNACLLSVETIE